MNISCKTHIVDCLKQKSVDVFVESSSVYDYNEYDPPENALSYETTTFFASKSIEDSWWQIDFKQAVSIDSYLVVVINACAYVTNWTVSLSMDNKTFIKVDEHSGYYPNGIYQLGNMFKTRYFRVNGNSGSSCPSNLNNVLAFNYIQFFGTIDVRQVITCNCRRRNLCSLSQSLMILLLTCC